MPLNCLTSVSVPAVIDPLFANVAFQLDTTGATIKDVSKNALALTINGTLAIDSGLMKNGEPTVLNTTGYVQTAQLPLFDIANQDACIEGWFLLNSLSHQNTLWRFAGSSAGYNPYLMLFSDGKIYLRSQQTGSNIAPPVAHNCNVGELHHFEVDKVGNTWYVFIDGVMVTSGTVSGVITDENKAFWIGEAGTPCPAGRFYGVRVTMGSARHTSNFTPPSAPLPIS